MILKICNWEKYQPRKDLKSMPWVRIDSSIFFNEDLDELDAAERCFWFFLLTYGGFKNSPTIEVKFNYMQKHSGVSKSKIESCIEKMLNSKCLVDVTNGSDQIRTDPYGNVSNVTKRTRRTERNETESTERETASAVLDSISDSLNYEYLEKVSSKIQSAWVKTYEDTSWIKTEINKAVSWCLANPHKTPKSQWGKFFTNWLSRGWESHRKTLSGNSPRASTRSEIDAQHVKNLHRNNPYRKTSK